jgi:hypothetical protein
MPETPSPNPSPISGHVFVTPVVREVPLPPADAQAHARTW